MLPEETDRQEAYLGKSKRKAMPLIPKEWGLKPPEVGVGGQSPGRPPRGAEQRERISNPQGSP